MKKIIYFLFFVLCLNLAAAVDVEKGVILDPTGINLSCTLGQNVSVHTLSVFPSGFQLNNTNFTFAVPNDAHINITSFNYTDRQIDMLINGSNNYINFTITNLYQNTSVIYAGEVIEHNTDGIFSINITNTTQILTFRSANIFILNIYDEETNTPIVNTTVYMEFISDDYANNYTLSSSNYYINNLPHGRYEIRYYAVGYKLRSRYPLIQFDSQAMQLYLLDSNASSYTTFLIQDETGNVLTNATLTASRYFVGCNCYKVIAEDNSNFEGLSVLDLQPYLAKYKFLVNYGGSTIYDSATGYKLTETTYTLTGALLGDTTESFFKTKNLYTHLTYDNDSYIFSYTVNDPTELIDQFCLYVDRLHPALPKGYENICTNCLNASTGTVLCNMTSQMNKTGQLVAKGWLHTNTQYSSYWQDVITIVLESAKDIMGKQGVFLSFIFISTLFFVGLLLGGWAFGLVAMDVAFIITAITGLIEIPLGGIITLVALSGFIIYFLGDRQ